MNALLNDLVLSGQEIKFALHNASYMLQSLTQTKDSTICQISQMHRS